MINMVITKDDDVGAIIRSLRTMRQMTGRQLAEKAELTVGAISRYENGNRLPSVKTLNRLLDVLDAELFVMEREAQDD